MTSDTPQERYWSAYAAWQVQLEKVHAVLLDGEELHPSKLKGLLNREANAKAFYDDARRGLLGLNDIEDTKSGS